MFLDRAQGGCNAGQMRPLCQFSSPPSEQIQKFLPLEVAGQHFIGGLGLFKGIERILFFMASIFNSVYFSNYDYLY